MDVQPVDLRRELRQGVQLRLDLAPVVPVRPVARSLLQHRELHALRRIRNKLLAGPARLRNAPAQLGEPLFGDLEMKGADFDSGIDSGAHVDLRSRSFSACDDLLSGWGQHSDPTPAPRAGTRQRRDEMRIADGGVFAALSRDDTASGVAVQRDGGIVVVTRSAGLEVVRTGDRGPYRRTR